MLDPEKIQPGYIPEKIVPGAAIYDFVFQDHIGAAPKASKDWRPVMQPRERQGWWPFCVTYSRLACAEAVAKAKGLNFRLSRLVLGVLSGTGGYWHGQTSGNSLEAVSETFRNKADVLADVREFTADEITYAGQDVWDKAFQLPDSIGSADKYFGGSHSWVIGKAAMVAALEFSPLQIACGIGDTWENDGVVKTPSAITAYHAITVCFIDAANQIYIQDSIGKEWKILSPDYPLTGIKSFRDLPDNWKDLNAKGQGMQILEVEGETTLVLKTQDNKYHEIATGPELYPFVAKQLGLVGQTFGTVSRADVNANIAGQLKAGLTFVDK